MLRVGADISRDLAQNVPENVGSQSDRLRQLLRCFGDSKDEQNVYWTLNEEREPLIWSSGKNTWFAMRRLTLFLRKTYYLKGGGVNESVLEIDV